MDHEILLHRLKSVGLSSDVIPWFKNYLSGRTQCIQAEGKLSDSLVIACSPRICAGSPFIYHLYKQS